MQPNFINVEGIVQQIIVIFSSGSNLHPALDFFSFYIFTYFYFVYIALFGCWNLNPFCDKVDMNKHIWKWKNKGWGMDQFFSCWQNIFL